MKRWLISPTGLLVCLLVINLFIGISTFRAYGESADEASLYWYAGQSSQAYPHLLEFGYTPDYGNSVLRYYGPAFLLIARVFVSTANRLFPGVGTDFWHLSYFLVFQVSILCLYWLCKRWLNEWAALGTAVLFSSQPLLWGHAFINPKDIPFMAFFLGSIVLGLWMLDVSLGVSGSTIEEWTQLLRTWWENLKSARVSARKLVVILLFLSCLFGGLAFLAQRETQVLLARGLEWLSSLPADNPFAKLILSQASQWGNVPTQNYAHKAALLIRQAELILFALSGLLFLYFLVHTASPSALRLNKGRAVSFLKSSLAAFRMPIVILAGVLVGLTVSIRVLGFLALVLVCLVALFKYRNRALPILAVYTVMALFSAYLSWPYLWANPIGRILESFHIMSAFPWEGKILFNGINFPPGELPASYLPVLMSLQFTEPVVILFFGGLIVFIWHSFRKRVNPEMLLIVLGWGMLPILTLVIMMPPMYDNFRQFLFLIPPLFILVGLALEQIKSVLKKPIFFVLVLVFLSMPGWLASFHLYPYQYIYYNSFIGGPQGAFRRYETDYWMTSFREATAYVNSVAPENARLIVWGAVDSASRYARPDLIVDPYKGARFDPITGYDFAIITSRGERDARAYGDAKNIFLVEKDGVTMSVVKKIK